MATLGMVWANTPMSNSGVAIAAKNPIALGKSLTAQPTIKMHTAIYPQLLSMLHAPTLNMVNRKELMKLNTSLPMAHALQFKRIISYWRSRWERQHRVASLQGFHKI